MVRVQWASSAKVAFKARTQSLQGVWQQRVSPTPIEIPLPTLDLLGWDQLLKLLFRAKGKTEQTLLDFIGELEVEQLNTETLTLERATELEALKAMAHESLFRYADSKSVDTKVPSVVPTNSSLLSVPDVAQLMLIYQLLVMFRPRLLQHHLRLCRLQAPWRREWIRLKHCCLLALLWGRR